MNRKLAFIALGVSAALGAGASSAKGLGPGGTFAITDVKVEVGDGSVVDKTNVIIKDGVIAKIGGAVPADMASVDGTGKWLTPGLIESRTQLGAFEVMLEDATVDWELQRGDLRPAFRVADAFNPASSRIRVERKGGVTDAILGPTGGLIGGTGAPFSLTGWPRKTGAPVGDLRKAPIVNGAPVPGAPVAMFASAQGGSVAMAGNSKAGVWLRLRAAVLDTLTYRKAVAAYDRGDLRPLSMGKQDLEAFVPVVTGRLPLVLAVDRAADIMSALRLVDEMKAAGARLRLVVAGGTEAWKVAAELKARAVPVIVTPSAQTPHSFDSVEARDDNPALLHAAGVTVILSTHNWDNNVRRLRQEAGIATSWGMPRAAALSAITQTPAKVFGLDRIGTVAIGQRANLVLWEGDPLECDVLPLGVWIDGEPQALSSRQSELALKYGAGRHDKAGR